LRDPARPRAGGAQFLQRADDQPLSATATGEFKAGRQQLAGLRPLGVPPQGRAVVHKCPGVFEPGRGALQQGHGLSQVINAALAADEQASMAKGDPVRPSQAGRGREGKLFCHQR